MNGAYVSAFAALGGSVVGGLVSGAATWMSQRSQLQAGTRARQLAYREELFRDFIVAATRAYSQAMLSDKPELHDIVPMYGMINRMQVICSPRTVASALHVARTTLETYLQPNKTFEEILAMMRAGNGPSPLSEFAEAAREELRRFDSGLDA
ncbi:MAG TPA: hypothetical protein VHY79_11320 [Rhizomicrobium sp.]|jgi:hypothetical protein|nr:hypothetical protein [Rhizomicrobium sp.]